jgi:choline transport protein
MRTVNSQDADRHECLQWETIVSSLYQALSLGGPTVLVWGFVIAALGAIFVSLSLAEMAR